MKTLLISILIALCGSAWACDGDFITIWDGKDSVTIYFYDCPDCYIGITHPPTGHHPVYCDKHKPQVDCVKPPYIMTLVTRITHEDGTMQITGRDDSTGDYYLFCFTPYTEFSVNYRKDNHLLMKIDTVRVDTVGVFLDTIDIGISSWSTCCDTSGSWYTVYSVEDYGILWEIQKVPILKYTTDTTYYLTEAQLELLRK